MTDSTPGWQPDPTGKHDHRYWDGRQWTENVADAGVAAIDPYDPADEVPAEEPEPAEEPAPFDETRGTYLAPAQAPFSDGPASWPTEEIAPGAQAAPPSYVPEDASAGGEDDKKRLLIGGGLLALAVVALIAFMSLGGDDSSPSGDGKPNGRDGMATTTTMPPADGTYGSDPALDDLYDACKGGDYAACDQLYLDSPSGSEYESFGDTCGDRNEPGNYCVELYADKGSGDSGEAAP